jgi:hypothetical protein
LDNSLFCVSVENVDVNLDISDDDVVEKLANTQENSSRPEPIPDRLRQSIVSQTVK